MRNVALVLVVALAVTPGCSFVAMRIPATESSEPVRCTRSQAWPIADTAASVVFVGGVGLAYSVSLYPELGESETDMLTGFGVASAALAFVLGLSAWYGYRQACRCRAIASDAP